MEEHDHSLQSLVAEAAECVRKGGVILYPTETVYGLGCDPFSEPAVRRIQAMKGRDAGKPMLVLTDSWERVQLWINALQPVHERLMALAPPLPLTILFSASERVPVSFRGDSTEVAIRCTADLFCRSVIAGADVPLLSTSANPAGMPAPAVFSSIQKSIRQQVDLAVDAGRELAGMPSTVVRAADDGVEIVREGAVARNDLSRLLETPVNR